MDILTIQQVLREKNLPVLTALDLQRFFGLSRIAAQKILERYTKRGVFERLKKGFYILKSNPPSSFCIANVIYRPSYVSFESALSFYRIIPESIFSVTSATSRTTKNFNILEKDFQFLKVKKEAFIGYHKEEVGDENILIAEPEKALADYFYFVSLGKKEVLDRLNTKNLSAEKLDSYIKLFKRKSLGKIIQKYL